MSDVELRTCRGCGARFERRPWALDRDLRASPECWHAYGELSGFQVEHPVELGGLTQLAVDVYGVQHAGSPTPSIRLTYGLVGLHLALERGTDGLDVRAVHQRMGKPQDDWPRFDRDHAGELAAERAAEVTVQDVLREGRDAGSIEGHAAAVQRWARTVWAAWSPRHADVAALAERFVSRPSGEPRR